MHHFALSKRAARMDSPKLPNTEYPIATPKAMAMQTGAFMVIISNIT